MNIQFPPFLHEGDKVAIVSPSSKIDRSFINGAQRRLESWGLEVVVGKSANGSYKSLSGKLTQRLRDLQTAMDDETVKAILCSRGGYGAIHLVDKLDFTRFRQHPKWLIGFSDITALHNLFQANGFASLHAPMARHLTVEPADDPCTLYLREVLFGKLPTYICKKYPANQPGKAKGILRGGNLSVLYGLRGTPYDIPPQGTILFIEDISERPHAVERMMYNLRLSGVLGRLSGLIIGKFTEFEDDRSLGKDLFGLLHDLTKEYHIPVCFNFAVGHVTDNLPLINGAEVEYTVGSNKAVELKFDPETFSTDRNKE